MNCKNSKNGFIIILLCTLTPAKEKIAIVTELNQESNLKKSIEFFPDTLDVEVETDEGREVLHLVKQKSINTRSIPVRYDDPELNKKSFQLKKVISADI